MVTATTIVDEEIRQNISSNMDVLPSRRTVVKITDGDSVRYEEHIFFHNWTTGKLYGISTRDIDAPKIEDK